MDKISQFTGEKWLIFAQQRWEIEISKSFKRMAIQDDGHLIIVIIFLLLIITGFVAFAFISYYRFNDGERRGFLKKIKSLASVKKMLLAGIADDYLSHRESYIPEKLYNMLKAHPELNEIYFLVPIKYKDKDNLLYISEISTHENLSKPYFNHSFFRAGHEMSTFLESKKEKIVKNPKAFEDSKEIEVLFPLLLRGHQFFFVFRKIKLVE